MADYYNKYPLNHFAGNIARCMDITLPEHYAPPIDWVCQILEERLGGPADRVVLYHADAVALYMWQKYTEIFAPVYQHSHMAVPYLSTVPSVTPVAHASMYTGVDPEKHGIQSYVRPKLECSTLYDELLKQGHNPAILAMDDSSFLHIFKGRDMDYYSESNSTDIQEKALELIASDKYDVLSIHTFGYDDAAHSFGPESKQALNALSLEAEGYRRVAELLEQTNRGRRTLLVYAPDHGQHLTMGGRGDHGSKAIEDMNVLHFFQTITK